VSSRRWFIAIIGVIVGTAGFFLTLWWTEPAKDSRKLGVAALVSRSVSDAATLKSAAQAAGLQMSDDIKGHVAVAGLPSGDQVRVSGWAVDIYGDGTPLTVVAFSGGRSTLQVATRDRSDDVAKFLRISPTSSAVKNVMFEGIFSCGPGDSIVVVAVSRLNDYSSWVLPGCSKR
jgi:hypothetical protein